MNIEEFKNTLIELRNNLDNEILKTQIIKKDKNFNFDILIQAIENYIQNINILVDSTNDMLLNQIKTRIDSLLKLTYDEFAGLQAVKFTQYANFLIKNAPQPKHHSENIEDTLPDIPTDSRTIEEKYNDLLIYLSTIKQGTEVKYKDLLFTNHNEFKMIIDELEKNNLISNGDWALNGSYFFHGFTFQGEKVLENMRNKAFEKSKDLNLGNDKNLKIPNDNLTPSAKASINITASATATVLENNKIDRKLQLNSSNIHILNKKDIPAALGVKKIASVLSSIIIKQSSESESGMMIGIFGKWGRGKTYLFDRISDQIKPETTVEEKAKDKTYEIVRFSAWKYQDTQASWGYLYERFMEGFLDDKTNFECNGKFCWVWNKLKEISWLDRTYKIFDLNRTKYGIWPILTFLISFILYILWSFIIDKTALIQFISGTIGLIIFFKLILIYLSYKSPAINLFKMFFSKQSFKDILGFQSEVQRELTILLKTWIPDSNKNKKIILFVDDLDRCYPEQIISILDGLRVILDEEDLYNRLIIVTAIDEDILKYAIEEKYKSILKKEGENKNIFKEYMEKVFLVGIKLNTLTREESKEILKKNISENTIRPIRKNDKVMNTKSTDTYKVESELHASLKIVQSIEGDDFLIDEEEKTHLLALISKLENNTPRRIRIFYYKYLIFKKLLHMRFEELNKLSQWKTISNQHLIVDILIDASNDNLKEEYSGIEKNIFPEIKYVVEMISVL